MTGGQISFCHSRGGCFCSRSSLEPGYRRHGPRIHLRDVEYFAAPNWSAKLTPDAPRIRSHAFSLLSLHLAQLCIFASMRDIERFSHSMTNLFVYSKHHVFQNPFVIKVR